MMSVTISALKRSVRIYSKIFVGGLISFWGCLCLLAYSRDLHVVLSYVFTFLVPYCDVRYDYRIERCSVRFCPELFVGV